MALPDCWTQSVVAPDSSYRNQARDRQSVLTKPPGSLGQLEELAVTLCAQQRTEAPAVDPVYIAVFAADHGVCDEGVSAFPQSVTSQMIANFASGGAAISVLSAQHSAHLEVVNLGTVTEPPESLDNVISERIRPGTRNLAKEPSMSTAEAEAAISAGDRAAQRAYDRGCRLFIAGDMGIGNTTSAAALACAILGESAAHLAGPGTGLDHKGVDHKASIIEKALERHGDDRTPLSVLASLGGLEIAAITGAILGAAQRGIPVLVDGYIVSVAALIAVEQQPGVRSWLHFSHRSAEPGHERILAALEATPLLDLGMRLGEGSGAAVAVPLMRSACALHNHMASFADAGVDDGS